MVKRDSFFKIHFINKSKSKNLILIHGLYANSGFWLPYLKYFKNYSLIIYEINYENLLKINFTTFLEEFQKSILKLNLKGITTVIGHSLGCILSRFLSLNPKFNGIEIAPVYLAKRNDSNGFVNDVSEMTKNSSKIVQELLTKVDQFISFFKKFLNNQNNSTKLYFPSNDQYFTYERDFIDFSEYDGDHFDLFDLFKNKIIKINIS